MPVTIIPGKHLPKAHPSQDQPCERLKVLRDSCPDLSVSGDASILANSENLNHTVELGMHPSPTSLVHSAIEAWSRHSHLIIRPDQVWLTVLLQLNLHIFNHWTCDVPVMTSRKERIELKLATIGRTELVEYMRDIVRKRLLISWMKDWIEPNFSTTTADDLMVANMMMLGTMESDFEIADPVTCGIPSITLQGDQRDWILLAEKTEHLKNFGLHGKLYADNLRPLLKRMMASFDDPESPDVMAFWNDFVHAETTPDKISDHPPIDYRISGWMLGLMWEPGSRYGREVTYDGITYYGAGLHWMVAGNARLNVDVVGATIRKYSCVLIAGCLGLTIQEETSQRYREALQRVARRRSRWHRTALKAVQHLMSLPMRSTSKSANMSIDEMTKEHFEMCVAAPQSTIQPQISWMLCTIDFHEYPADWIQDAANARTIDAINSCDGIVHDPPLH